MNWILEIPLELRLIGLFVLGAFAGAMANLAAYRLAWNSRHISPWSAQDVRAAQLKTPPRRFFDCMPIWGWLGLSREASLHGRGFWIRPMLVELCCGFGLAWLYWWEVDQAALLPREIATAVPASWTFMLHAQFAVHAILIWLMLAASLIDADEKTIPDAITVPGGLLGLLIAAAMPLSLLPAEVIINNLNLPPDAVGAFFLKHVTPQTWSFMTVTAPLGMPAWLGGRPHTASLLIALACWFLACFALLRRRWYGRHGRFRALVLLCARLRREPSTWRLAFAAAAGGLAIAAVWAFGERTCWTGLLTSLVGMAAAGGLVWAIRIIASAVMRREAMGFGDVTLMGMIGAFLGWQASLIVFFIAPIVALIVGIAVLVLRRDNEIPYGPFLCLAALAVIVRWESIWRWAWPRFEMGAIIPAMIAVCLVMLPILLGLWQIIRRAVTKKY